MTLLQSHRCPLSAVPTRFTIRQSYSGGIQIQRCCGLLRTAGRVGFESVSNRITRRAGLSSGAVSRDSGALFAVASLDVLTKISTGRDSVTPACAEGEGMA